MRRANLDIKQKRRFSKKQLIVFGVLAALALVALYIWASVIAWNDYDETYKNAKSSVKQASQSVASAKKEDERRQSVTRLATKSSNDNLCETSWWYGWQQSISPSTKEQVESCQATEQQINKVKAATNKLSAYYQAEDNLATVLAKLRIDQKSLTAKNWDEVAKSVVSVREQVTNLDTQSEAFEPVRSYSVKTIKSINNAWKSLQKAHSDKNRADFTASIDSLDNSYQQLKTIAERSTEAKANLHKDVVTASEEL